MKIGKESKISSSISILIFVALTISICSIIGSLNIFAGNLAWSTSALPHPTFNASEVFNLSNNKNDSVYGNINSLDHNHISVVWQDSNFKVRSSNLIDRNYDVYFKNIDLNNTQKGEKINVSNNSGFSEHPHMAVSGNNTYLAWVDNSNNVKQVYLRSSEDRGQSFDKPLVLSSMKKGATNVDISAESNFVYLTWQQRNLTHSSIVLRVSDDFGKTFEPEKILANYSSDSYPRVISQNGSVYVSWNIDKSDSENPNYLSTVNTDGVDPGVYFIKSTDNGITFGKTQLLSIPLTYSSGKSQVSAYDNFVYVNWVQKNSSNTFGNMYTAKSTDGGKNFEVSMLPLGQYGIFDASSLDSVAFGDKLFLSIEASLNSSSISNSREGNDFAVAKEIFFTLLSDNQTSNDEIINLSENVGISECPSITLDPINHIVSISWEDYTPGNHEILMRQVHYQ